MTRGLFATMLERADTQEAIGLSRNDAVARSVSARVERGVYAA